MPTTFRQSGTNICQQKRPERQADQGRQKATPNSHPPPAHAATSTSMTWRRLALISSRSENSSSSVCSPTMLRRVDCEMLEIATSALSTANTDWKCRGGGESQKRIGVRLIVLAGIQADELREHQHRKLTHPPLYFFFLKKKGLAPFPRQRRGSKPRR